MKSLIAIFTAILLLLIPYVAFAQPEIQSHYGPAPVINYHYPPSPHRLPAGYVYRCYMEVFPVLHEVCEYVRVYTPSRVRHLPPSSHRSHMPPPPKRQAPPRRR